MSIINKKARLSQLDEINQFLRLSKSYWGYDENFLELYMKKMGMTEAHLKNNTSNLIYYHDELIGFYSFKLLSDGILELDKFFLHPEHIGKGHGRYLWQACCETATALGKKEFIIWSDLNAEAFYLKLGCVKIGRRESLVRPGVYLPVLRYEIA